MFSEEHPVRIAANEFPGAAAVAVPLEPVLYALAAARWPRNWQPPCADIDPPDGLTHVLFWVETPCLDIREAEAWAAGNYPEICARVRRSLLTPPLLN